MNHVNTVIDTPESVGFLTPTRKNMQRPSRPPTEPASTSRPGSSSSAKGLLQNAMALPVHRTTFFEEVTGRSLEDEESRASSYDICAADVLQCVLGSPSQQTMRAVLLVGSMFGVNSVEDLEGEIMTYLCQTLSDARVQYHLDGDIIRVNQRHMTPLPTEIWAKILDYLVYPMWCGQDISNLRLVCSELNDVVVSNIQMIRKSSFQNALASCDGSVDFVSRLPALRELDFSGWAMDDKVGHAIRLIGPDVHERITRLKVCTSGIRCPCSRDLKALKKLEVLDVYGPAMHGWKYIFAKGAGEKGSKPSERCCIGDGSGHSIQRVVSHFPALTELRIPRLAQLHLLGHVSSQGWMQLQVLEIRDFSAVSFSEDTDTILMPELKTLKLRTENAHNFREDVISAIVSGLNPNKITVLELAVGGDWSTMDYDQQDAIVLGNGEMERVTAAVGRLAALKELRVFNVPIGLDMSGLSELISLELVRIWGKVSGLMALRKITHFMWIPKSSGDLSVCDLLSGASLSAHPSLKSFVLCQHTLHGRCHYVDRSGLRDIAESFPMLTRLDVGLTRVSPKDLECLSAMPYLQDLSFDGGVSNIRWGEGNGVVGIDRIGSLKHLRSLSLNGISLDPAAADAISMALYGKCIVELNLSYCRMMPESLHTILSGHGSCAPLRHLESLSIPFALSQTWIVDTREQDITNLLALDEALRPMERLKRLELDTYHFRKNMVECLMVLNTIPCVKWVEADG